MVKYEKPEVVDYGTLLQLTQSAGHQTNSDLPKGKPNTAYS